mgnify:CR=1 FL=1
MQTSFWFLGIGLATFLDFVVGVSVAVIWLGKNVPTWAYVLGGILALLPDFDLLFDLMWKQQSTNYDHHQNLSHRPLVTITISAAVCYLLGGISWGLTAACCLLWHFIHDTEYVLTGGGIAWFWPASNKYWSWKRVVDPKKSLIAEAVGQDEKWFHETWLQPSPAAIQELSLGIVLLTSSVVYLYGFLASLIVFYIVAFGIMGIWALYAYSNRNKQSAH